MTTNDEEMMISVHTSAGSINGAAEHNVLKFLGIPFGKPPVGAERWRHTQQVAPWEGVHDALDFAPGPIQTARTAHTPRGGQSEDCLYLNVWTPHLNPDQPHPVMFWIHGGGFLNGAASMPIYDGSHLAASGVTVVSVEYRLGAFGFLADGTCGTNFGVTDWIVGLQWVRDNVAAFGGDPSCVTIFGQSAGAAAVRTLLSAPAARGLFHRGIIQSAGFEDYAVVASPSYERSVQATQRVMSELGVTSIEDLRSCPTEDVRAASLKNSGIFPPVGQVHTPANLAWYPVVDGDVVHEGFEGWPEDVPVMLGCTEDEARMFITPTALYAHPEVRPEDAYTADTLTAMATALAGENAAAVLEEMDKRGLTHYEALAEIYTAAIWNEPAVATLDRFSQLGRTLFYYRFARVGPGAEKDGTCAGHAAENPYIFGVLEPAEYYNDIDREVSRIMQSAWVQFARSGVPEGPDGVPWPAYDPKDPHVVVIAETATEMPLTLSATTALIREQRLGDAR